MENRDKNERDINLPREREQPLRESNEPLPDNLENDIPELDGDGLIGNTGGFYGGTSYIGSNYGPDWNEGKNSEGNFGAAGQKDESEDDTDIQNKKDQ